MNTDRQRTRFSAALALVLIAGITAGVSACSSAGSSDSFSGERAVNVGDAQAPSNGNQASEEKLPNGAGGPQEEEEREEEADPVAQAEELLEEYARRQPYLSESDAVYHGFMTVESGWDILRYTTDERIPPAALGFLIHDYDRDGMPELVIVNKDGEDMPVLEVYEVTDGEVALQDWTSDFHCSSLYSIFRWEESEFACSLQEGDTETALVIEQKSVSPLYADGVSVALCRVGYDGEHFQILGTFEEAGSDFSGSELAMEKRLREAGCTCAYASIVDEHRPFYLSCRDLEPVVCVQTRLYYDEVAAYDFGYDYDGTNRNRDALLAMNAVSDIRITDDAEDLSW